MQQIAAEMNLSETAFVEPANTNGSNNTDAFAEGAHFKLRWFTPVKEVQFCGHATLATAATLFQGTNCCACHTPWWPLFDDSTSLQKAISKMCCTLRL